MVLNAVQNAAKCKTKSIKIHRNCINKTFRTMKHMAKKAKIATKKWNFRGIKGVSGSKKYGQATKLERLNGAKCRFCS